MIGKIMSVMLVVALIVMITIVLLRRRYIRRMALADLIDGSIKSYRSDEGCPVRKARIAISVEYYGRDRNRLEIDCLSKYHYSVDNIKKMQNRYPIGSKIKLKRDPKNGSSIIYSPVFFRSKRLDNYNLGLICMFLVMGIMVWFSLI